MRTGGSYVRTRLLVLTSLLPLGGVCAMGCAGTSYQGGHYQNSTNGTAFHVEAPGPDWERVTLNEQNDLAWHHPSSSVIQINASCDPALDIPLSALTNHLMIGFTDRTINSEKLVSLSGREALETHVDAKLDGVLRTLVLTVLKKDGCVYDFALVVRPEQTDTFLRSYRNMIQSFSVESAR